MPLQLTTPINTGDLDPNAATYDQVRIVRFSLDSVNRLFELITQEGNTVDGAWVAGVSQKQRFLLRNQTDGNGDPVPGEQHYTDMVTKTMADASMNQNDYIYDGASHHLYQWLIDQGHYVGTIV